METAIEANIANESGFNESDGVSPIGDIRTDTVINGNEQEQNQRKLSLTEDESPQEEMVTSDTESACRELKDNASIPTKSVNITPLVNARVGANAVLFARGGVFGGNWQNQNPSIQPGLQIELWVETKTAEGKSYFYHAQTRETTWTRPEGPNVKVMSQIEIEDMNKKQQQPVDSGATELSSSSLNSSVGDQAQLAKSSQASTTIASNLATQPPPNLLAQPPPTQQQQLTQPPPNVNFTNASHQLPPGMHQQPPPFFQSGMHPPNFGQPPFGMPPPGYGGFPSGHAPWGMPWNAHLQASAAQQEKPAKNLILKPGVIDPAVIARAAEWSEHRAPDGRPYYYHAGRGESIWEKPQAMRDMEAARMAAHSGATPQQAQTVAPAPSHLHIPNPLMHMPPAAAAAFDPALAFNAVAAATIKANESSKAALAIEKEAKRAAEEKRKKDEEQKKSAAAAKPVDKSRPISSTPIAGTPWCVVWTGDARVFFYNPSTRTSVWERPEDLLDREDVDKAVANTPDQLKSLVPGAVPVQKIETQPLVETKQKPTQVVEEEDMHEDNEVINIRTESESSLDETPTKKARLVTKQTKKSDANEAAAEAEQRAAKERAVVPLETRVKQFKDMLREKDVSAFSTWEKELHKIVFDPRYLLLTSKERKQVFEKYVKDRAEEERKEKRNKMRQKREDFRKLMEDAKLHGKSSFSDFCQRSGKEERYKAIEKVRERESLFNEYIVDVRRREKEDKLIKKELIRKEFLEMLRERSDIDRHTRWHDLKKKFDSDARYRAVENSMYREEYFQDYMRIVKDEKRKEREQKDREDQQRERDRKLERNKSDRKDKERGRDRSRSKERDRSVRSEKDRNKEKRLSKEKENNKDKDKDKDKNKEREKEKTKDKSKDKDKDKEKEKEKDKQREKNGDFKKHDYSDEGQHSASDEPDVDEEEDDEVERLQKVRDRQLRAELSIREREKEVLRTLAGHLRDRDKEREHHKRDEAIGHFNALLTDLVRNPDLTWKEVKRQLRKDHRWEMIETLDRDDREKIFNEHIDSLVKKKREKFREMLDENSILELTSSWKDIKKLIKEDPRYLKYSNSDKCEREFRDYIKDKTINAKVALRELLQECKLITHKSNEIVKENPNHLKEIQDILKNDKRYLVLDHVHEERTTIVLNYLEELHKRGPPPPPTASESTRRNK